MGIFAAGGAVGLGLVLIAWTLASAEVRTNDQMPAVNLGIAGVALAGAACTRFLRRGRQALAARRAAVSDGLRQRGTELLPVEIDMHSATVWDPEVVLVSSDLMTRYHRVGCQLVAGKPTLDASRGAHVAAGRRPCGVCEP